MDSCSRSTSQESGASCCDLDIEEAEDLEENCDGNKPSEDFNDEDERGDQDIHDMTSLEELEPLALSESRENSPKIRQLLLERARSQDNTLMIQIAVDQDKIQTHFHGEAELQLVRALTATSLLHREHCSYAVVQPVLKYWQNRIRTMPVEDVLLHLAGSRINVSATDLVDAGDFIATLSRWQIRVFAIGYKNCSSTAIQQMLDHFGTIKRVAIEPCDCPTFGRQNEDLAMAHFQSEEIELFELAYNNEFPARVVEAYLNAFEQSDVGLGELKLRFPASRLPEQLPHCGLQCNLLHQSDQRFELLLHAMFSSSADPRKVIRRAAF